MSSSTGARLSGHSGITAETNANGSLRRFDCGGISLLLFVGNELEGGPANLYLRRLGGSAECTPLLGPQSPTCFEMDAQNGRFAGTGSWLGVDYSLELVLSKSATAWFWHVRLDNGTSNAQVLDITYAQDLALAPYGAVRMNEFYVSQYIDHTPLAHPTQGVVVASRQNQAADGRHPWCIVGSLRKGASFATDALQFHGLANREGTIARRFAAELPNRRLQHEHSMVVIRDDADPPRAERKRIGRLLRRILRRSSRGHVRRRSRKGETDHRPARSEASFHSTQSEAEGRSRDAFQPRSATSRTRPYRRRAAHVIRRAMAA